MSFYLSPYRVTSGLDLEMNRANLLTLRDRAREVLPSHLNREWKEPYNSEDFSVNSGQTGLVSDGAQRGALQVSAREIALQIFNRLQWGRWTQFSDRMGWTFFYRGSNGGQGPALVTQRFHVDALDRDRMAGLWIPNADVAAFQVIGPRSNNRLAYCVGLSTDNRADRIAELIENPENELRSHTGNICVEFPLVMCHRRQPIDASNLGERYSFRIND